jgi:hypothetical protein
MKRAVAIASVGSMFQVPIKDSPLAANSSAISQSVGTVKSVMLDPRLKSEISKTTPRNF